jgi:hypothetical protein
MRVLFVARHFTYFRNFESVVRRLADKGHAVHLAAEKEEGFGGRDMVERLAAEYPTVTVGFTPARADARGFAVATALRLSFDYFRYLDTAYDDTPAIRARAHERTPRLALALARMPGRRALAGAFRALEPAVPTDAAIDHYIREQQPDVLVLTPLIDLGSPQLDYLKSARAAGVPAVLAVWSWDHLTSKSLIRLRPDRVFVWNPVQRREAADLHGVPDSDIVVTGAQCFDQWFDRAPSRDRAAFTHDAGLPPDRPYLLWVCSALFKGSPSEAAFVKRWIAALRASGDPILRDCAVLVRPHPQRMAEWRSVDLGEFEAVAVWGSNPIDARARADYFDSLYYARAVVGLNTSALIEAAIVDRPVHTIVDPEYWQNQTGTLHFRYLTDPEFGFLRVAPTLDEHLPQLAASMRQGTAPENARFVERFIRPLGREAGATDRFVEALEDAALIEPRVARSIARPVLAPVVAGLRALSGTALGAKLLQDPAAADEEAARAARIADKRELVRRSEAARARKEQDKDERWRRKRRQERVVRLKTLARRIFPRAHGAP